MKTTFATLSYLSLPALFASVLMIAIGVKGDPMNLQLALWGAGLFAAALLVFPRPDHPVARILEDAKNAKKTTGTGAGPRTKSTRRKKAATEQDAMELLQNVAEFNAECLDFEGRPQPYHAGWSRLDLVIGKTDAPTSWIGGLPEMPDDVAWPKASDMYPMFVAQIALADLPADIWGGLGPKSGWLLFFVAPGNWGGVHVIHTQTRGTPRPYPDGECIANYLSYNMRDALSARGQALDTFRPPQWALKVSPTNQRPPNILQMLDVRDKARRAYNTLEPIDPRLAAFATGTQPTLQSIEVAARDAYTQDPDNLDPDIRTMFEAIWSVEADAEAITMSGPVEEEFFYVAPDEPVALIRLPSSELLGWSFGDMRALGIFIAPKDLQAGRWNKVWFDISD